MDTRSPLSILPLLSPSLITELLAAGEKRHYEPGQLIHSRGGGQAGLSIILSGAVRFGIYSEDGEYIQTGLLNEGNYFGEATLFAHRPRVYDAEAYGKTEVLDIKKSKFEQLLDDHPPLARAMLQTMTNRLYFILDFVDDLRTRSVEGRVARQILRWQQSTNDDNHQNDNTVSIRHSDLAFALSLSRVSVGKALDTLKRSGAISLGYGKIEIHDTRRLSEWP